jgi:hypothetical protein
MLTARPFSPRVTKCNLYGTEVRYCGRIITAEGMRYDSRTMSTLQHMGTPQNSGDLVQYVAALAGCATACRCLREKAAPLQDLLEVVYKEPRDAPRIKPHRCHWREDGRRRVRRLSVLCAAKDETSVEFMRPLLNSWAECSVVISC